MTLVDPAFTEPEPNWQPCGSFQQPVTVPASSPDAGTLLCLPAVNQEWLPLIIGCIDQMLIPATWGVLSDAAMVQVLQWVQLLKLMVSRGGSCMLLRWSDADCAIEQSTDGGSTWTKISGWPVGPPACFVGAPGTNGTNGTNGTDGTNGVTPQLRWSGCSFQVSTDAGATWSNLSGFSLSTLSHCLVPSPPAVSGQTTASRACAIAAYLASQIVQGALAKAVQEYDAGATLLAAAAGISELLPFLNLAVPEILAAATGLYLAITAGTRGDFNTAATDAALSHALECAIYLAIVVDGEVTPGNFAAVQTAIAAIAYSPSDVQTAINAYISSMGAAGLMAAQQLGPLYIADCSACSGWCFEWDFRSSNGGFAIALGGGSWVAGQGWESAHFTPDNTQLILISKALGTSITIDDVVFGVVTPDGSATADVLVQLKNGSTVVNTWHWTTAAGGGIQRLTDVAAGPWTGNTLLLQVESVVGGTGTCKIVYAEVKRASGSNPLGSNNCVD